MNEIGSSHMYRQMLSFNFLILYCNKQLIPQQNYPKKFSCRFSFMVFKINPCVGFLWQTKTALYFTQCRRSLRWDSSGKIFPNYLIKSIH